VVDLGFCGVSGRAAGVAIKTRGVTRTWNPDRSDIPAPVVHWATAEKDSSCRAAGSARTTGAYRLSLPLLNPVVHCPAGLVFQSSTPRRLPHRFGHDMSRSKFGQKLTLILAVLALLILADAVAIFAQLVMDYGFWAVVTKPIYPVSMKPKLILSNGDVWSTWKYFLNFLVSGLLWITCCLFAIPRFLRWVGISESDLD